MRFTREMVLSNLGLKVVSLLIAILLWYIISAKGVSEMTLELPIEYINIPQGFELLQKNTDTVKVTLFGSERILRSLKPEDLRVRVDLRGTTEGEVVYELSKKDISVPSAITISEIYPTQIKLYLDRRQRRAVPVRLTTSKGVRDRYILEVKPPVVEIEGPSRIVTNTDHVRTQELREEMFQTGTGNGEHPRGSGELELHLIPPHKRVRLIQDTVRVIWRQRQS